MPTDSPPRKRDDGPRAGWTDPTCGVCLETLAGDGDGFECRNRHCNATYTHDLEFAGWADEDKPQCESRAAYVMPDFPIPPKPSRCLLAVGHGGQHLGGVWSWDDGADGPGPVSGGWVYLTTDEQAAQMQAEYDAHIARVGREARS